MQRDLSPLVDKLRSLARVKSREVVQQELENERAEDIAEVSPRLETEEVLALLNSMEPVDAADTLVEMPAETQREIITELDDATLAFYLDILPMDDALDLRETIGEERFDGLLELIPKKDAQEIRRLLTYHEDSVGRLMTEAFFEVTPSMTMATIIADIRRSPVDKYEMVNDIYVLDDSRHLVGVISLRKVIRANPNAVVKDLMNDDVVSVNANLDALEAARRMSRYGFYALPVIDDRGRMVGIFTGDDAQEVLEEGETESLHKFGAVSGDAEAYMSLSVIRLVWMRLPWLLGLFVAEFLTTAVLKHYGTALEINPLLIFMPLIIGAGGNSGSQVTTMVTRALALGDVRSKDWFHVMRREIATSICLGACLGLAGFVRATIVQSDPKISLIVGFALPAVVLWAGMVGSLLPLGAKRLGVDPAVMSAPFISTFVDATGLIIYFEIAMRMMGGSLTLS